MQSLAAKLGVTAGLLAFTAIAGAACADDNDFKPKAKGEWIVDLRVTDVAPQVSAPIVAAGGTPTGLDAKVSSSIMPTVGVSYFFTDHVALEVIAGTTQHQVKAVGGAVNVEAYDTWVLPPVISLQYHFLPKARFSPYVGTGPNIMLFYSGSDKNGFAVKLKDGVGWAVQGGFDYAIKGPWSLNVDVKKVWFETDATIDGGALTSKVNLDPIVGSVGIGYRF